jgi:MOSC domain-containing protein YiiM
MLYAVDGITPEVCAECGFDSRQWEVRDAATLLRELGWWWRFATDGLDAETLESDEAVVLADLEREGAAMAKAARDGSVEARTALLHAAHDASHHMMVVGRKLAAPGAGMRPVQGRVVQVNASGGGVPKLPVPSATIGLGGVAGDVQNDRKHHGRPFQALCLWSAEVIDGLAADGHPIGAGCAGENLTVSGIEWTDMRPGARLRIGSALAEISFPATPCAKQSRWFHDRDFGRIDFDRNPHLTRWYAWVREPGEVAPGDAISSG